MYSEKRLIDSAVFLRTDVLALEAENCRLREKLENVYLVASGENGVWDKVKKAGKATWDFLVRLLENIYIFMKDVLIKILILVRKAIAWMKNDESMKLENVGIQRWYDKHGHPIEPIEIELPYNPLFENDGNLKGRFNSLTKILKNFTKELNYVMNKPVTKEEVEKIINDNKKEIEKSGIVAASSQDQTETKQYQIFGAKRLNHFVKLFEKLANDTENIINATKPVLEAIKELTNTVKKDMAKVSRAENAAGDSPKELFVSYIINEIQKKIKTSIINLTNMLQNQSGAILQASKDLKQALKDRKIISLREFAKKAQSGEIRGDQV